MLSSKLLEKQWFLTWDCICFFTFFFTLFFFLFTHFGFPTLFLSSSSSRTVSNHSQILTRHTHSRRQILISWPSSTRASSKRSKHEARHFILYPFRHISSVPELASWSCTMRHIGWRVELPVILFACNWVFLNNKQTQTQTQTNKQSGRNGGQFHVTLTCIVSKLNSIFTSYSAEGVRGARAIAILPMRYAALLLSTLHL